MKNIVFVDNYTKKEWGERMDIRQLRYFTAIVEEGNITAAAKKLNISQPPLSTQMHLLEEELGTLLFERRARQIHLTETGTVLYQYAREILDLEFVAREEIGNIRAGKKGSLRIGLISSCDSEELYRGFRMFHTAFPEMAFKVYEGNTYELLENLEKERIELAVVRTPFQGRNLEKVTLKTDFMMAVGQPGTFSGEAKECFLRELAEQPLILYRRWEKIIRSIFEKEDLMPKVVCVNDDARTSLQWAAAGFGTAIVPASILNWRSGLETRKLLDQELVSDLVLVRAKNRRLSEGAVRLYQIFQEEKIENETEPDKISIDSD